VADYTVVTILKEQLSAEMIDAGAQLVAKLDEMGVQVVAALWLFTSEENKWRLLISTSDVDVMGALPLIRKINEAKKELGEEVDSTLGWLVSVVSPRHEMVQAFRAGMPPTGAGIARIRRTRTVVDRRYVDDALIYRIA
jgi:hypothetical protein